MNPSSWWTLKIIFSGTAVILGLLASIVFLLDFIKGEKQQRICFWFHNIWEALNSSRWRNLPELVIQTLLERIYVLVEMLIVLVTSTSWPTVTVFVVSPLLLSFACFLHWGLWAAVVAFIISFPNVLITFSNKFNDLILDRIPTPIGGLYISGICAAIPVLFTTLALQQENLFISLAIMVLIFPVAWFYLLLPVYFLVAHYTTYEKNNILILSFSIVVSFIVTFSAFFVGNLAEPTHWVPQTVQMLVANIVFDGVTFMVTVYLLSWAIKRHPLFRIPFAVAADIVFAAVFACLSLFVGVALTEYALSPAEVLNVLFARSPQGNSFEIGPYFWAMHTAFLPTLLYLSIIFIAWLGKALLLLAELFFGAKQAQKNPLRLTALLLAVIAALFTLFAFIANTAHELSKERYESTYIPKIEKGDFDV